LLFQTIRHWTTKSNKSKKRPERPRISLKKGNGEVLFTFNNLGLEQNSLGNNLTKIDESSYKLLDNQGNQLSLLFLVNNNQLSLKLLKANGDGVQYNLTRDANLETYNIAGIVANQAITECSASQFINLPTTSTTSALATTSTTSALATTSTTSALATTAELRLIQRTCNQTITDQHVQQNFYNDGDLFFSINASKNASAGKNTSISFAIGEREISFSFNPSQTIQEIASFFKRQFGLSGYVVEYRFNPSNPNKTIIDLLNFNPANTSLIITKNSGNITYQLAVNQTIINQCSLLTTNIVEQFPEIKQPQLKYNQSNTTCSLTANGIDTNRQTYDQDGKLIKTAKLYSLVNASSNVSVSDVYNNKLVYSADNKLSFYNSSSTDPILQFDLIYYIYV